MAKVAIIGRTNVGKSALFNRLCNRRHAIVADIAGVTRDRISGYLDGIEIVDTAGLGGEGWEQTEKGIEDADLILLVVDGKGGIEESDRLLANLVKKSNKKKILVVNKLDSPAENNLLYGFYRLGIEEVIAVSALHRRGITELREKLINALPTEEQIKPTLRLAIVGAPNTGKSTFANAAVQSERCLVSPIPGTTRDLIEIRSEVDNTPVLLVDTAGTSRRKPKEQILHLSALRAEKGIAEADVCLLLLDVRMGIQQRERRLCRHIEEKGKGCLLVLNKSDLISDRRPLLYQLRNESNFIANLPKVWTTAKEGKGVKQALEEGMRVGNRRRQRISTGQLNRHLTNWFEENPPPRKGGKGLKIYYLTQASIEPPTFVFFVNNPSSMEIEYRKYLLKRIRESFDYLGVPLRTFIRSALSSTARKQYTKLED